MSIRDRDRRVLDREQMRETALALDTDAERLTDQLALTYGDERRKRTLVERRADRYRAAALLRKIAND